jgi:hypothetical protein
LRRSQPLQFLVELELPLVDHLQEFLNLQFIARLKWVADGRLSLPFDSFEYRLGRSYGRRVSLSSSSVLSTRCLSKGRGILQNKVGRKHVHVFFALVISSV